MVFTNEDFFMLSDSEFFKKKKNGQFCQNYIDWSIEALKNIWKDDYIDFDFVIDLLKNRNKTMYEFGKTWSSEKDYIRYYKKVKK